MCMSSAKFNPTSQLLGRKNFGLVDPVIAGLESVDRSMTTRKTIPGAAAPIVPDAQFVSPNTKRAKGYSSVTGASTLLGG